MQARLKPVLSKGTDVQKAAEGFRDARQFATLAHAARNTQVPFVVLKHHVLNEREEPGGRDSRVQAQPGRDG